MKHLLSAIAVAALIGAVPAWAQTSSSDHSKQPMPQASSSDHSGSGTSMAKARRGTRSPEDNMAEQLNRQELQRVQANGAGTTAGSGMTGSGVNGGAATSGATTGTSGSSLPASGAPRGSDGSGNLSNRAGSEEIGHPSPGTMEEHPGAGSGGGGH
jgi:hypothetical protein